MEICIACGNEKNKKQIINNGYNEPLCLVCEKEIREEAIQAMDEVCSNYAH